MEKKESLKLPVNKTLARSELESFSILIHGMPKIGKSTFCSNAENTLFLATEPGLNSLDVYQLPIKDWPSLMDACGLIASGDHKYKTIVIDTIDNAYKLCQAYICSKYKIDHESDMGWGKGHAFVNNEFQRAINKMIAMPYGLYMISHSQAREIETRTSKHTKIVPTLPDKVGKIITGMVDMILFCDLEIVKDDSGNDISRRVLRTTPNIYFEAGNRLGLSPVIDLDYGKFKEDFIATMKRRAVKGETKSSQKKTEKKS